MSKPALPSLWRGRAPTFRPIEWFPSKTCSTIRPLWCWMWKMMVGLICSYSSHSPRVCPSRRLKSSKEIQNTDIRRIAAIVVSLSLLSDRSCDSRFVFVKGSCHTHVRSTLREREDVRRSVRSDRERFRYPLFVAESLSSVFFSLLRGEFIPHTNRGEIRIFPLQPAFSACAKRSHVKQIRRIARSKRSVIRPERQSCRSSLMCLF